MLQFFREKKEWIVWGIVIFFVATMFSGSLFFKNIFKKGDRPSQDASEFASLGGIPVNTQKYSDSLRQTFAQFKQEDWGKLDPELIEMLQYAAFNQAVQYTALLEGAVSQKVKVSSKELDQALNQVLVQYDLKNIDQFKEILKKNKIDFSDFKDKLKEDIKVQKFASALVASIRVTDTDVRNTFIQVQAQHLLVKPLSKPNEAPSEKEEQVALKKIEGIAKQIRGGLAFEKAAQAYSDDPGTKAKGGDLGWVKSGQTVPEFEKVLFSLDKGEISTPVKTTFGYHLIRVLDRKGNIPATLNMEKEKEQLLRIKQSRAVQAFLQGFIAKHPLKIKDNSIKAYQSKLTGDIQSAINSYQSLISQNPASPAPHYVLAKLYVLLNDNEKAKEESKKAKVKAELTPQLDFPTLHTFLGKLAKKEGNAAEAKKEFDKAIALAGNNDVFLSQLKRVFGDLGESGYQAQVTQKLAQLPKGSAK